MDRSKLIYILSMLIFGTLGLIRRLIPWPSGFLAMTRGFGGALSLLIIMLILRKKLDWAAIKKNLVLLIVSGACIGVNWMLLFEAYNHTTVATASLCYYMAPIFLILAAPLVLKEKMTLKKALCVLIAIIGMVLVSGIFGSASANWVGIALGWGLPSSMLRSCYSTKSFMT